MGPDLGRITGPRIRGRAVSGAASRPGGRTPAPEAGPGPGGASRTRLPPLPPRRHTTHRTTTDHRAPAAPAQLPSAAGGTTPSGSDATERRRNEPLNPPPNDRS
ncbi:hypothetical protein GCM10010512_08850 [Streptomyces thermoviolaceus subsp. thermoviolaceus]|nr:hypothetical protein GCM10010499_02770 [Streptomyces thermoviolaceus subsp. apingens]GHA79961.1 hypothetical protein GCM10010512_08850 [Streptomyces thermoviolaceus subsp. thermoviolaceus]